MNRTERNILQSVRSFHASSMDLIEKLQSQIQLDIDKISLQLEELEAKGKISKQKIFQDLERSQTAADRILEEELHRHRMEEEILRKKQQEELVFKERDDKIEIKKQESGTSLPEKQTEPPLDLISTETETMQPIQPAGSLYSRRVIEILSKEKTFSLEISKELSTLPQTIKSVVLELKMKINTRIGQITQSAIQNSSVVSSLRDILIVAKQQNEHLLNFSQYFLSDKICDQAAILTSSHLPSAIPISQIVHEISHFDILPQFFAKLLGMLIFKCPFLNGNNPSKATPHQLGYRTKIDGTPLESSEAWIERMRGYISLFTSILLYNDRTGIPVDAGLIWALLASILNTPIMHPWVPFLLVSILDIGSSVLFKTYKNNYLKLVYVIKTQLLPLLITSNLSYQPKSSLPKLEILVDEILLNPLSIGLLK